MTLTDSLLLPLGLGLLGFVEPCTVGSSLLFAKHLEGRPVASKLAETAVFTLARALFIGGLGALAALAGPAVLPYQRAFWGVLGAAYVALGLLYLAARQGAVMRAVGPALARGTGARGAAALGLVFGLNVPACAAPLLGALFAATLGAATVARGFWTMAVFGLALSLPLVALVWTRRGGAVLDRLAAVADRVPRWTGVAFIALGAWSIALALR